MNVSPSKGFSQLFDSINGNAFGTGGQQLNPLVITILVVVLFFYLIVFNSLGAYGSAEQGIQGSSINFMEIMMWGMMIFLVLINGIQYFFDIDIKTGIKNLWSRPEIDVEVKGGGIGENEEEPEKDTHVHVHKPHKEVYHIRRNIYSYDDAKAVCKAHGAKLANYSQIENAYNSGAEWCGYGWSDGQMGLFPTQKDTWEKMQKGDQCKEGKANHDCGRPGINGGYFDNPNLKLGVNCYGVKRKADPKETARLNKHQLGPKSKEECKFDEKVEEYRKRIADFRMSSWNKEIWKAPETEHAYNTEDMHEPEQAKPKKFQHVHKSHAHEVKEKVKQSSDMPKGLAAETNAPI